MLSAMVGFSLAAFQLLLTLTPAVVAIALLTNRLDLLPGALLNGALGLLLWLVYRSLREHINSHEASASLREFYQAFMPESQQSEDDESPQQHPLWSYWQGGVVYGLSYVAVAGTLRALIELVS